MISSMRIATNGMRPPLRGGRSRRRRRGHRTSGPRACPDHLTPPRREIARTIVSDDSYKAGLVAGGMPETFADFTLGMFEAMRAGDFAAVDPTLEQLLGRRPTTLAEVIATATPQAA
jgi:hypothetical protein